MAHFAKIDENNIVTAIEVVSNDTATSEQVGVDFLNSLYGTTDTWKQTSFNTKGNVHALGGTPFRKNYASIGMTFDSTRDAFYAPQPFNSWTLNETTCLWEAPIPHPDDGNEYVWDENTYQEDNTLGWLLKG